MIVLQSHQDLWRAHRPGSCHNPGFFITPEALLMLLPKSSGIMDVAHVTVNQASETLIENRIPAHPSMSGEEKKPHSY